MKEVASKSVTKHGMQDEGPVEGRLPLTKGLGLFFTSNDSEVSCYELTLSPSGHESKEAEKGSDLFKVLLRKDQLALFVVSLSSLTLVLVFLTKRKSLACTHHLPLDPRP